MSKIWIMVIIIVLAILGYFIYMTKQPTNNVAPNYTSQKTDSETAKGSIQSLMTAGKNVNCTFNYPDQSSSGTIYVSGEKFRGDFTTMANGKEMVSHMIQKEGTSYMWTDENEQGTMFKIEAVKPSVAPGAQTQTADLNREVDYKCSPGGADESKFTPPAEIKFTDMSAMMKNIPKASGADNAPKMDKSVCDSIADVAAKAQCMSALTY